MRGNDLAQTALGEKVALLRYRDRMHDNAICDIVDGREVEDDRNTGDREGANAERPALRRFDVDRKSVV